MKKSEELRIKLDEAKARLQDLLDEERRMRERFPVLRSEIGDLSGGINRLGLILTLKSDIKKALLIEQDQLLPHVVCKEEGAGLTRYVLTRVTPKRIYARPDGSPNEFWFDKITGKAASTTFLTIDVEATLAEWERYRATNEMNKE